MQELLNFPGLTTGKISLKRVYNVREVSLEELDTSFRLTLEKAQKAIAERYFHYARTLIMSLLDHYPNCPALRLMQRQTALVTKEHEGSMLLAWIKTAIINTYHTFRNSPLKHMNRLERVLLVRPDCLFTHRTLAQVAMQKEMWGTAALSFEAIATLSPKSTHEQILLARCYLKLGRVEDAQTIIKAVLTLQPQNDAADELLKQASVEQTLSQEAWKKA